VRLLETIVRDLVQANKDSAKARDRKISLELEYAEAVKKVKDSV